MARVRRALSTGVVGLLACAPFVGCSGDAFKANGASGAAGSGATSSAAGQDSGGEKGGSSGESGRSGSASGGSASGGAGGAAPTGGVSGMPGGGTTPHPEGGDANGGSGGNPTQPSIPKDGLALWFKSDVGVKVEDGVIVSWADQSGNGRNAKPDVPSEAPTLANAAEVPLPLVLLDGVDDHLHLPAMKLDFSAGLSFFAVAGRSHAAECAGLLELTTSDAEVDDISFDSINDSFQFEVFDKTIYAANDAFPEGKLQLIEALQTPDALNPLGELFANGKSVGTDAMKTPLPVERTDNAIGDSAYSTCYPFPGGLGEILFYTRKLTEKERVAVESYLQEKWLCCR